MDLENNRHQEYFRRQQAKEKAMYGVGRGHRFNSSRSRHDVIERVRLRREERLQKERAQRMRTGEGREREDAADSVCSVS